MVALKIKVITFKRMKQEKEKYDEHAACYVQSQLSPYSVLVIRHSHPIK